jgi:hypothetical protein
LLANLLPEMPILLHEPAGRFCECSQTPNSRQQHVSGGAKKHRLLPNGAPTSDRQISAGNG